MTLRQGKRTLDIFEQRTSLLNCLTHCIYEVSMPKLTTAILTTITTALVASSAAGGYYGYSYYYEPPARVQDVDSPPRQPVQETGAAQFEPNRAAVVIFEVPDQKRLTIQYVSARVSALGLATEISSCNLKVGNDLFFLPVQARTLSTSVENTASQPITAYAEAGESVEVSCFRSPGGDLSDTLFAAISGYLIDLECNRYGCR